MGELRRADPKNRDKLYPVVATLLTVQPPHGPLFTPSIATPPDIALHVGKVVAVAWAKNVEWDAELWTSGASVPLSTHFECYSSILPTLLA